jgi:hypothetical protein
MSTLVLAEQSLPLWDDEPRRPRAPEPSAAARREPGIANGPTLADALASAWQGLSARASVACPVCHGEFEPRPGGGRCRDCGTTLS